jgi:hypothetical protein
MTQADAGVQTGDTPHGGDWGRAVRLGVDIIVLTACVVFILVQLGPRNLVSSTTPAGGDMGAHVWGPAYLRDHLLPSFRITGWAPDWYAGFPAFQFYMVVPALAIVALNVGVQGPWMVVMLAGATACAALAVRWWADRPRRYLAIAGAIVALVAIALPYGVAFKLVSVSGALTLPLAAYAFGRLSGLRFPGPAMLAIATLPFLFYQGFTIYGGNLASTLAGEFAFSMSLSLGLVYLGVVLRGLETGQHRALAAVLLALTGLCHIIPAFWVLAATAVIAVSHRRRSMAPAIPSIVLATVGVPLVLAGLLSSSTVALIGGAVLCLAGAWLVWQSVRWLTPVMMVAGMLSAFWVFPFVLRADFVNDMGWEKLPRADETGSIWDRYSPYLLPSESPDVDLRWVFALALLGAVLSVVLRLRVGVFLSVVTVTAGVAFLVIPEGRLWNGRLLPFYYLTAMLLALLAVWMVVWLILDYVRSGMRDRDGTRAAGDGPGGAVHAGSDAAGSPATAGFPATAGSPTTLPGAFTAFGALAAVVIVVGLPLGALPFSEPFQDGDRSGYRWPTFSPWQREAAPASFVPGWAEWNYSGYEEKDAYREYYEVVTTMAEVGEERGCGRALWEYEPELDRYGTPMALMLLPYWTDGCIASMEGLFFEASVTTPYHFLMQTELSANPSAAQRDMPYGGFDIDRGVQHLQLMGVRYYMATSAQAIQEADGHPDLSEIATSGPWEIYEVAGADVVSPLLNEPAVLEGVGHSQPKWLEEPRNQAGQYYGPSVQWFLEPERWDVLLAVDGPDAWQRIEPGDAPDRRPVPAVEVADVQTERDRISFAVDDVGSPILVRVSYFPNWQAHGADGPWRVAPNLMVVVPTDERVELRYGHTPVEWLAYGTTVLGLAAVVLLASRGAYRFRTARQVIRPPGHDRGE